ncbi:MAG TPA: glycoside hydrolase family 44 protein [Polyangiaceae bacterium]
MAYSISSLHLRRISTMALAISLGSCLTPPGAGPAGGAQSGTSSATSASTQSGSSGGGAQSSATPGDYYDSTWSDASGNSGTGGVKLTSKPVKKSLPLRQSDFDPSQRGDDSVGRHSDWLLFHGSDKKSLSFEWEWVTKADEKYWGMKWAGAGIAFNASWMTVDASAAKYLVVWSKASKPDADFDVKIGLHCTNKAKGAEDSGKISLAQYTEGKKLQGQWTRAVIPLSAIPNLDKIDLKSIQTVLVDLDGTYPENERVSVLLDDIYFSDVDMLTPVENVGYMMADNDLVVFWDKQANEKFDSFVLRSSDGKDLAKVTADKRTLRIPLSLLGASGRAKVGVVALNATQSSSPQSFEVELSKPTYDAVTVTLDANPGHEVSPYIFGSNYASASIIQGTGITIQRWGGNGTSKYNWQGDLSSAGNDWFFLNTFSKPPGTPETEKDYYKYIKDALDAGAQVNFSIPIQSWIAKPHPDKGGRYCSYPLKLYPEQEKNDGQGCGNGMLPGGKEAIWDNDPSLGMVPNSPEFQKGLIENIKKLFGGAAGKGVKFYTLDNEPGIWNSTHRDTQAKGLSSEELANLTEKYAEMIKTVDPAAKVIGFAAWGVMDLAGSNFDYMAGPDGYKHYNQFKNESDRWSERKKHGGKSQLEYLLGRLKEAEKKHGKRLVDAIDIHWYPELYGKDSKGETRRLCDSFPYDPVLAKKQFDAIREYYDSTYKPDPSIGVDSWTSNSGNKEKLWDPYHPVIPALKKIIEENYPGTKLAINEYASGDHEYYLGALIRSSLLGIFMQEDLYMAENWYQVDAKKYQFYAQKMYGNYDGKGSRVRGRFVKSTSSSPDLLSYAAKDGDRSYIVLVNKNDKNGAKTTLKVPGHVKETQTYLLSESVGLRLYEAPKQAASGNDVKINVPPFSAMLVVMR